MSPPKLHLGTIGWSYGFWRGKFYPDKTANKDLLTYYASKFSTVEVDSTFYRIPTPQTIQNWHNQTPDGFLFSLKFPQVITHVKMLRNCQPETAAFLSIADLLGKKLGALLLQFPPSFTANHLPVLADYLRSLPEGHRYVVEVRNKTWLTPDFYALLRDNNVTLAWTDSQYVAETAEVTADLLYVRWEGDRATVNGTLGKIEADRTVDLKNWSGKLKPYLRDTAVLGYFGKYYSGYPPNDIFTLQFFLQSHFPHLIG